MIRTQVHLALALFAGLFLAAPGSARALDEAECDRPSNVEISACLMDLFTQEDAELNRVYKLVVASIDAADYPDPPEREKWKKSLRDAQRAWIAFKEADCRDLMFYEWWGGTGYGIASLSCQIDLTRARTADLKARYQID